MARHSNQLSVRLSDEQRSRLDQAASNRGTSATILARAAIVAADLDTIPLDGGTLAQGFAAVAGLPERAVAKRFRDARKQSRKKSSP